jgi:hypothetical protein
MRDRAIHGVRVLGPSSSLGEVVAREHVDEVVLTTTRYSDDLVSVCRRNGVRFRDVGTFFRAQLEGEAQPAQVGAR